jgi:hypothetical protein
VPGERGLFFGDPPYEVTGMIGAPNKAVTPPAAICWVLDLFETRHSEEGARA